MSGSHRSVWRTLAGKNDRNEENEEHERKIAVFTLTTVMEVNDGSRDRLRQQNTCDQLGYKTLSKQPPLLPKPPVFPQQKALSVLAYVARATFGETFSGRKKIVKN